METQQTDLRGLSLTPPWPWSILRCGKRIENRLRWTACSYRGPIALHASGLPGPFATWWRRVSADPSYMPTACQKAALLDFMEIVGTSTAFAHFAGIAVGPIALRELCSMAGHIVGTASIVGVVQSGPGGPPVVVDDTGPLRVLRDLSAAERQWWMGGFALLLADVREIEPIACKGAQGLWRPSESVRTALERQTNG